MTGLPPSAILDLQRYLEEDIRSGDITTSCLDGLDMDGVGTVFSRERVIVAGVEETRAICDLTGLRCESLVYEGNWVSPDEPVLRIAGSVRTLLAVERVILNIMMRMCGIATKTYRLAALAKRVNPHVRVAATRKTTPGFRFFEKRAVMLGGGDPHRFALDDMVLIKNNHIAVVGGVSEAVKAARRTVSFTKKISCETRTLAEVQEAIEAGADIILLDNFTPKMLGNVIRVIDERGLRQRVILEASGGIDESNIEEYAACGVDIISCGAITHSYRSADLHMSISLS
ncbi:MAG: carboxylating nicotinate-nucleotide diphosphorylase [Candidatus Thorarchaeota archaeon]